MEEGTKKNLESNKRCKVSYEEMCSQIALLCEEILETADGPVPSKKGKSDSNKREESSKFRQLLKLANSFNDEECDYRICRLAIISLVAVIQDILPSYHIRLPT